MSSRFMWLLASVRHVVYVPLELCRALGIVPPGWLFTMVEVIDRPFRRALLRVRMWGVRV